MLTSPLYSFLIHAPVLDASLKRWLLLDSTKFGELHLQFDLTLLFVCICQQYMCMAYKYSVFSLSLWEIFFLSFSVTDFCFNFTLYQQQTLHGFCSSSVLRCILRKSRMRTLLGRISQGLVKYVFYS